MDRKILKVIIPKEESHPDQMKKRQKLPTDLLQ
jgi:hypothetical protein